MGDALKGKTLRERIDWVANRLGIAIVEGRFRDELSLVIQVVEDAAIARLRDSL